MSATQFYFPPYNSNVTFNKWDVVQGDGVRSADLTYYYSLINNNLGNLPTGRYNIPVTSYTRSEDVATLFFTQGSQPVFNVGSIISVTGMANVSLAYTGMLTAAGAGWVSYTNGGWPDGASTSIGAITTQLNPAWTTGFAFIPAYQTKADSNNKTITAQLGDGYSQRSPNGINAYDQTFSFVYTSRSLKEIRAMMNFVQYTAGSIAVQVLYPLASLDNQPSHRFTLSNMSYTNDSFGLVSAQLTLQRQFDA